MKRFFVIALLFIAFKASAQTVIPAQDANKYVGQTVSAFGYVYKVEREASTKTMVITFGSKFLLKGVVLRLKNEYKLDSGTTFQDLDGKFITVTGKITKDKGKLVLNGDDPSTNIAVRQSLAVN